LHLKHTFKRVMQWKEKESAEFVLQTENLAPPHHTLYHRQH